jgi:hypothetical protein
MMSSQIDLALNDAPKGKPRYFMLKEDTLQPKMLAKTFNVHNIAIRLI